MSHDLSCSQEDLDEAVESKNRETFIDGELENDKGYIAVFIQQSKTESLTTL